MTFPNWECEKPTSPSKQKGRKGVTKINPHTPHNSNIQEDAPSHGNWFQSTTMEVVTEILFSHWDDSGVNSTKKTLCRKAHSNCTPIEYVQPMPIREQRVDMKTSPLGLMMTDHGHLHSPNTSAWTEPMKYKPNTTHITLPKFVTKTNTIEITNDDLTY